MSKGTTPLQQLLMHYNGLSFKLDEGIMRSERWPGLQLGADEFFQFCSHVGWNFYLVTTKLLGEVDGLTVGAKEFNAGRTIAKMVVEAAFYLRVERALDVFKEQALDVATAEDRPKQLLNKIHSKLDAGIGRDDSRGASILRTCHV
jgi:hypothetical protein